ncbi:PREDICTED: extracellular calcium-sensing receptor-like [Nanorana parkeri]|uniref:extracellular calcium-sensing receptor-like n=1 Tax=Nanorana parkeri TaxID=125878 RepID=UPI0008544503|nr:PREDICTED: extracellular calcium-sensing receptor-like [Nanorana parkeri]
MHAVIGVVILSQLIPVINAMDGGCILDITELEGLSKPGNIIIGAVFPLHLDKVYHHVSFTEKPPKTTCTTFHFESYQHLHALIFAVEEINKDITILPNISIGFQTYDSCTMLHKDLEGTLQILTGSGGVIPNYRCLRNIPLSSVIGHSISTHSISVAHILGLYRYPQISYFSTSALLSDRTKFPSFFRTVPSDIYQSQGLAQLTKQLNWTWVGLLAVDNDYGQQGIQLVTKELLKAGACVAFSETILRNQADRNALYIVNVIKKSTANTVVIFSNDIDFVPVLDEMLRQNISSKIFIASEAWSTSTLAAMTRFSKLLLGTVGFAFHSATVPEFQAFLNKIHPSTPLGGKWMKIFWEQAFGCKFSSGMTINRSSEAAAKECTGDENLDNVRNSFNDASTVRVAYNVYTAVHAVGKALEDLNNCRKETGPQGSCANIWNFKPWQLLPYIRKVRVKMSNERELYFDENGDPPAVYDIVNWQLTPEGAVQQVKVGSYDTKAPSGEVFIINSSVLMWPGRDQQVPPSVCRLSCLPGYRKVITEKEPACCFHCVSCPLGEVSNHTDSLDCFRCPWDQWPNKERTKCLQKTIEYLSYDEPLGTTLTSVSVASSLFPVAILKLLIDHKSTPIVKASNYSLSCLLLVCLSLCFLCPLVFIGYPQPLNCLLRQATFGIVFSLCISCVLSKTIMVVLAFLATRPSSALKKFTSHNFSYTIICVVFLIQFIVCLLWLSLTPPFPQYNINTHPGVIIIECNEGSTFAFWVMLAYLGLLAFSSFVGAFLSRRLPDVYNEASYITFSMLTFLSVWVSYIPASLSSQGKYIVAMEVFAMLFSSWALVIFMFLPKCFIMLFRPSMNSREYLKMKGVNQAHDAKTF